MIRLRCRGKIRVVLNLIEGAVHVRSILVLDIGDSWRRLMTLEDRIFREMNAGLGELIGRLPAA